MQKTNAMTTLNYLSYAFLFFISCADIKDSAKKNIPPELMATTIESVKGIPLPTGFSYLITGDTAYANWLLDLKVRKSKTVYLYNGGLKENQHAQFAVLDINIGKKDLVQCADAVMKLRADHLFEQNKYAEIKFTATSGDVLSFDQYLKGKRWKERGGKLVSFMISANPDTKASYNSFMEFVYSYCGSYSLSKQLRQVIDPLSIQPGDVFVQGGFPGHAVTVMTVAKNATGKTIFLLSQGYMPAQDIHILKNYGSDLSPWFDVAGIYPLDTPQWQFEKGSLKRW
jgi:hypothetical protein